jgi:hypothetical protein
MTVTGLSKSRCNRLSVGRRQRRLLNLDQDAFR